jgi:DNA primase
MALLTKECLERLREKIDLSEIVGSYIELKRVGGKTKALCPFHNEKTPSFSVNKGDQHYHCFGCGAHGDAIAFLMHFLGVTFNEAVEVLANRYGIKLQYTGEEEKPTDNKRDLFKINQKTAEFFHFHLLYSEEGKAALEYLFKRGISEDFIKKFLIGYAPKGENFQKTFYKSENFSEELLVISGILSQSTHRPFFAERIMFPINDGLGNFIGFSGRKIEENVFGGKYINTKETPVFKKSKTLFGLNYSRKSIAKTGKVIVVEGQIDALRLIFEGIDYTVASQGTAFGIEHVAELLKLGVEQVTLCFDSDEAGNKSAIKTGQLFQMEGVEVFVCSFPPGKDPDSYILEQGKEAFLSLLDKKKLYLSFVIEMLSKDGKALTPAGKNALVSTVKKMMGEWKHPLMIHEGEKIISKLLNVPQQYLAINKPQEVKKVEKKQEIIADNLEKDLIRWLLVVENKELLNTIMKNINVDHLKNQTVKKIFSLAKNLHQENKNIDFLNLGGFILQEEISFLEQIQDKRINVLKAKEGVYFLLQKLLDREWIEKCSVIKNQIQKESLSEEKLFSLAKEFDNIKKNKPILRE